MTLIASGRGADSGFWLWLFSLAALPVGLNFGVRDPMHLARPRADRELAAVLGILGLAALLRLPLPALAPWTAGAPEPEVVAAFQLLLGGGVGPLVSAPTSESFVAFVLAIPLARFLGDGAAALRWGASVEGLLSLLLLHLVARRLVPMPIAALATLLVAILPWHVLLSWGGYLELQALVGPLLLFYLLLRAIDSRRSIEYLLAGYAAGLCLLLNPVAVIGPAAAFVYLLGRSLWASRFLTLQWRGLLVACVGLLAFVAPFVV